MAFTKPGELPDYLPYQCPRCGRRLSWDSDGMGQLTKRCKRCGWTAKPGGSHKRGGQR